MHKPVKGVMITFCKILQDHFISNIFLRVAAVLPFKPSHTFLLHLEKIKVHKSNLNAKG